MPRRSWEHRPAFRKAVTRLANALPSDRALERLTPTSAGAGSRPVTRRRRTSLRVGAASPIPTVTLSSQPSALLPDNTPGRRHLHAAIDDYDLCLHLARDDERRLAAIEAALLGTDRLASADGPLDLAGAAVLAGKEPGFTGTGLPAQR